MEFVVICSLVRLATSAPEPILMTWNEPNEEEEMIWEEPEPVGATTPDRYPTARRLLTVAEEITLARRAQAGDLVARNEMVESNIRLVISIAKRYTCRSMTMDDLIQEGIFGLIEAVMKFDIKRGCKFSTYASYWVRQGIVRAIEKQDRMIRLPSYGCNAECKIKQSKRRLQGNLNREPTVEEIAVDTGLSRRLIRTLQVVSHDPLSLDGLVGTEEDTYLGELLVDEESLEPEDAAIQEVRRKRLLVLISRLRERDAGVLLKRFGLLDGRVYSLQEIANDLGMSREGVRHIQNRSLRRLRQILDATDPEFASFEPPHGEGNAP